MKEVPVFLEMTVRCLLQALKLRAEASNEKLEKLRAQLPEVV